jgi:uncharacterized protein
MNTVTELWLFAGSVAASALGGMLGMASGIFIVPILTIFVHVDIRIAIGASILSVIACSCSSAAPFLKSRLTNVRLAIVLEMATTAGALSGVVLAGAIPTSYLFLLFGAILLLSAHQMLAKRRNPIPASTSASSGRFSWRLDSSYPDHELGDEIAYRVERLPIGMMLMYCAGLSSALLGIGSGVLKVPAMDSALRLPIKVSSATSNFMIGATAAASATTYFVRGNIVGSIAAPVALGSVVGALLGARFLISISNDRIRVLFVAVLVALAAQMFLAAFGNGLYRGMT